MRLQVFLSKSGISSRRAAKKIISSGKVSVNTRTVFEPAFKVDPEKDKVFVKGKRIRLKEKIYIMLHKPKGVITTKKDRFAKNLIMDLLPYKFRHLNPVGRLDKDTSGLMLLTNDGEVLNKLTHPRFSAEKVYSVELDKKLLDIDKVKLQRGIDLDGKYTAGCKIILKARNNLEIIMHEGRKRQIKRMFSKFGCRVINLKRVREHSLFLGALPEGRWRFLSKKEVESIWN